MNRDRSSQMFSSIAETPPNDRMQCISRLLALVHGLRRAGQDERQEKDELTTRRMVPNKPSLEGEACRRNDVQDYFRAEFRTNSKREEKTG